MSATEPGRCNRNSPKVVKHRKRELFWAKWANLTLGFFEPKGPRSQHGWKHDPHSEEPKVVGQNPIFGPNTPKVGLF
jgi:hypothetical protein